MFQDISKKCANIHVTREALEMKHKDDIDSENGGMTYDNYGSLEVQLESRCASHHEYMQIVTCLLNASAYSFLRCPLVGCIVANAYKMRETRSRRDDLYVLTHAYTYILLRAELS